MQDSASASGEGHHVAVGAADEHQALPEVDQSATETSQIIQQI